MQWILTVVGTNTSSSACLPHNMTLWPVIGTRRRPSVLYSTIRWMAVGLRGQVGPPVPRCQGTAVSQFITLACVKPDDVIILHHRMEACPVMGLAYRSPTAPLTGAGLLGPLGQLALNRAVLPSRRESGHVATLRLRMEAECVWDLTRRNCYVTRTHPVLLSVLQCRMVGGLPGLHGVNVPPGVEGAIR
uniref:Uncharacterized protein n=1 Tax=Cacopsylla melanoneura TaxID=428564 RepID=A0A8D8RBX2_9HEMI